MSEDVSGLIDLATAPDPVPASPAPTEEAVTSPTETGETSEDVSGAEGTDVEASEQPQEGAEAEQPIDARTNPAAVRSALKKLRDMGPEFAPIARQLNNSFGREIAYKNVFPKVADAQNAKALLDAVGGQEGFVALQENVKAIQATDAKLYAGDPSVLDDIIEDMRSEGKIDAFGKLASPFLEKLRATDEKAYFAAMKPHFYQGLRDVGLPNVVANLIQSLQGEQPNVAQAQQILNQMKEWFDDLGASVDTASKQNLDPERKAFEQERQQFASERQKEFQTGVAAACDSHNNTALGSALKQYLKLPFFKGWSRESLVDLGAGLKQQLYSELGADKAYQTQMDAFFAQKSPDKDKIQRFHQAKVDSMAQRIVKDLLNRRYPGFQKQQGAAAKPAAKPAATAQAQPGNPTKPQYVQSKPDWNDINWDMDPTQRHYITGRAVLKNGRFVSWNPKDKR